MDFFWTFDNAFALLFVLPVIIGGMALIFLPESLYSDAETKKE